MVPMFSCRRSCWLTVLQRELHSDVSRGFAGQSLFKALSLRLELRTVYSGCVVGNAEVIWKHFGIQKTGADIE
jgi:hypothetical protein